MHQDYNNTFVFYAHLPFLSNFYYAAFQSSPLGQLEGAVAVSPLTTNDFTLNSVPSNINSKCLPHFGQASYKFSITNIPSQSLHRAFPLMRLIFLTAPSRMVSFTA